GLESPPLPCFIAFGTAVLVGTLPDNGRNEREAAAGDRDAGRPARSFRGTSRRAHGAGGGGSGNPAAAAGTRRGDREPATRTRCRGSPHPPDHGPGPRMVGQGGQGHPRGRMAARHLVMAPDLALPRDRTTAALYPQTLPPGARPAAAAGARAGTARARPHPGIAALRGPTGALDQQALPPPDGPDAAGGTGALIGRPACTGIGCRPVALGTDPVPADDRTAQPGREADLGRRSLMRLLIDLQAIQGASGRRGIGRYSESLARAIVANAGDHEVLFGFTNQLPVPWKKAAEIGQGRVGRERTITYALPGPVAEVLGTTGARARIAELIREAAIADASPDAVLLSSLFEGHFEHLTTSIGAFDGETPVAVSLYDLIPLVRRETYFTGPTFPAWHMRKVESLRRAQRLLAISQSSKREAVDHLGIAPERIAVVYPAADPFFMPLDGAGEAIEAVRAKYGISGKFVMYTGGIDPRKNVEGMIEGYAALPPRARRERQLVIVCGILNDDRRRLQGFADRRGIAAGGIVFTGHVPDEDLRLFYNCCEVFVCPSLHEGFGLPILEAMACGAPALASNTSSMPEVVGREDALFDPEKPDSIAGKILAVLDDEGLARSLRESGLEQAKRFDRNESAKAAWGVLEEMAGERATRGPKPAEAGRKRRLAYLSPLPPLRSGISDYSAELLPELAKFYDIEVIADQPAIADLWIARNLKLRTVAWFSEFAADFDRVLYNVGNSEFHSHMFDLIERWPGVVILHEFFLSDLYRQLGYRHGAEEWLRRLYDAHGFPALRKFPSLPASEEARRLFPCSEPVFDQATGVI